MSVLFTNVRIFDAGGGLPYAGEVLVQGNRISRIARGAESLLAATRGGAEIMMRGQELGQIKEGFLTDLLLVAGDPLANLAVLQDRSRILAVMKDGVFHREPPLRSARRLAASVA